MKTPLTSSSSSSSSSSAAAAAAAAAASNRRCYSNDDSKQHGDVKRKNKSIHSSSVAYSTAMAKTTSSSELALRRRQAQAREDANMYKKHFYGVSAPARTTGTVFRQWFNQYIESGATLPYLYKSRQVKDKRMSWLRMQKPKRRFRPLKKFGSARINCDGDGDSDSDSDSCSAAINPWLHDLSSDDLKQVKDLLYHQEQQQSSIMMKDILVTCPQGRIPIRRIDLSTLQQGRWINDEIINCYFQLIRERSERVPGLPRVYAYSTFFYSTLRKGFDRVKRWTYKVNLKDFDIIFVPIHRRYHWSLAVIDQRRCRIETLDPLGYDHGLSIQNDLLHYLTVEAASNQDGRVISKENWKLTCRRGMPLQHNHDDCGILVLCYAECYGRNAPISFPVGQTSKLRYRIAHDILCKKLPEK